MKRSKVGETEEEPLLSSSLSKLGELVTALEKSEGEERERRLSAILVEFERADGLLSSLGEEIEAARKKTAKLLERVQAYVKRDSKGGGQ